MRTKACKAGTAEAQDGHRGDQGGGGHSQAGQVERGDFEATREGEDTPELDLEDRADIEATREGEDTPKLDQVDRGGL